MSKFVQFLTVCTGFGPAVYMHLVPVEDVETIRDVTSLFLSGDQDCSAGQSKDDLEIEKALEKYKSVKIVGEDDVDLQLGAARSDELQPGVEWDVMLPEGHSIVKVVARYVIQ